VIWDIILEFHWRDWGEPWKALGDLVFGLKLETKTFCIRNSIVDCMFGNSLYIIYYQCMCELWMLTFMTGFNTLPSGTVELRHCSPMRCWQVPYIYVLLRDVLHMCFSLGLAYLLHQGYQELDKRMLGSQVTNWRDLTRYF